MHDRGNAKDVGCSMKAGWWPWCTNGVRCPVFLCGLLVDQGRSWEDCGGCRGVRLVGDLHSTAHDRSLLPGPEFECFYAMGSS